MPEPTAPLTPPTPPTGATAAAAAPVKPTDTAGKAPATEDLVLNDSGTHALLTSPGGTEWWSPLDYVGAAIAKGYTPAVD